MRQEVHLEVAALQDPGGADEAGPSSLQIKHSERDKWGQHEWGHCEFHVF